MSEPRVSPVSQRVASLPPSGIRKFFDLIESMEGVIKLGVGEPDFAPPWHVRETIIDSLSRGRTSYTSNAGLWDLRRLIAEHLSTNYGVHYDPATEILVTVGVSEALDVVLRCLLDPGDEVVFHEPCFVSYPACVSLAGGVPVTVATREEEDFKLSPAALASALTPRSKLLLLNYPNNPTGATMTAPELADIANLVRDRGLYVISDEIYSALTYEGKHCCFPSLPGMRERTVLLNGFSKSHAMTGLRIGYAAGPAEIIEAMTKVHSYVAMCAPVSAQIGAIEALRNGGQAVAEMFREYDQRRRLFVGGLNRIGLRCFQPRGAFYAFPSIRATGMSSEQLSESLLREQRVATVPGSVFGDCGEGYLRCSYANPIPELKTALDRMRAFLREHHLEGGASETQPRAASPSGD
jgi:aminotransferase